MVASKDTSRLLSADSVLAGSGVVVDVAGVSMNVTASDRDRAEAVVSLLGAARPAQTPPCCELRFTSEHFSPPTTTPDLDIAGTLIWRLSADRVVIHSGGLGAAVSGASVHVYGHDDSLARAFRRIAMFALMHCFAQHERHLLHGAAFVINGGAVLVVGDSGSGKSTTAVAAMAGGWPILGDDGVVIRASGDALLGAGIPRPLAVPADALTPAGTPPGGRALHDDSRHRIELPVELLTLGEHPLIALLITGHGSTAASVLDQVDAAAALRAIVVSTTAVADSAARPALMTMAAKLARLPAFRLLHGTEGTGRVAQATDLLREVEATVEVLPGPNEPREDPSTDGELR